MRTGVQSGTYNICSATNFGSGTTLIEQIVASHPAVFGADELPDFQLLAAECVGEPEAAPGLPADRLRELGAEPSAIILEPCGRNTAPAVAVAALQATAAGEDPVLLVLPADHVIPAVPAFQAAVKAGSLLAEEGKLVTFGILPDKPETGYGYIKAGASPAESNPASPLMGQKLKKSRFSESFANSPPSIWNRLSREKSAYSPPLIRTSSFGTFFRIALYAITSAPSMPEPLPACFQS